MEYKPKINKTIAASISVYILWVIATYLLEGRIHTLLRTEAVADRIVYTVVANFIVGVIIAVGILRSYLISGFVSPAQIGFRSLRHTLAAVVIAGIVGFILFIIQDPPSLDPVVIMNIYAQVLPVSIAEVVICWAVIGASFESLSRNKGKVISLLAGILAASLSFGMYHFAHSPPFNQVNMVILLTFISLATGMVYFFGRDIYAAIAFHNTLALFGIMQALGGHGNLITYNQPVYPLIVMAIISVMILAASDVLFIRRGL